MNVRAVVAGVADRSVDAWICSQAAKALIDYLRTVDLQELASMARRGEDLAGQLPARLDLPDIPFAKDKAVAYLRQANQATYESIRQRVASRLPQHAALLGLDSNKPWYYAAMDRMRERLIADLGG